jgi:hypothetical protein
VLTRERDGFQPLPRGGEVHASHAVDVLKEVVVKERLGPRPLFVGSDDLAIGFANSGRAARRIG